MRRDVTYFLGFLIQLGLKFQDRARLKHTECTVDIQMEISYRHMYTARSEIVVVHGYHKFHQATIAGDNNNMVDNWKMSCIIVSDVLIIAPVCDMVRRCCRCSVCVSPQSIPSPSSQPVTRWSCPSVPPPATRSVAASGSSPAAGDSSDTREANKQRRKHLVTVT